MKRPTLGTLAGKSTYSVFGSRKVMGESTPYGFQSKWQHERSGLYDFGFRFYDMSLGKSLSRKRSRERGGLNLYSFAAHNPTNFGDAYGLCLTNMQLLVLTYLQGDVWGQPDKATAGKNTPPAKAIVRSMAGTPTPAKQIAVDETVPALELSLTRSGNWQLADN